MKTAAKVISFIISLCDYGVGIAVSIILIAKLDFISIFYLNGMSSNVSLFFNLLMFQVGLALAGVVVCLLANEYEPSDIVVEFPTVYMILPLIVTIICAVYGFGGETMFDKLFVVGASLVYAVLSGVIVYTSSRVFQLYPKQNEEK